MLADGGGEAELEQAFRLFDQDDTGYVSLSLAREYLMSQGSRPLAEEEVSDLLGELQPDAEGRVTMQSFRSLPCWQIPVAVASQTPGAKRANTSAQSSCSSSSAAQP